MFNSYLIPGAEGAETVDRIVAIVNDDVITLYELNQSLQPYAERIKTLGYSFNQEHTMLFKVREEILRKLIDEKIEDQRIKHLNIVVSEQEVDRTIERIKENNYLTDEKLRAGLKAEGLTIDKYRERLKAQLLRSKLVNREIKSKIVITNEDIKTYYDSHSEKYGGETKYHLRNILMRVSPLADEIEKRRVKEEIEAVLTKLKDGEPFENLVAAYSESPLASEGGDLGLFTLDKLSPTLREAVKDLKAGELTPVLDTEHGYQIFLVQEVIQIPGQPLEQVTPEIERILFDKIVDERFQAWLEELREHSHIKTIK
ncbi:MAG: SurA N-terminal domain-containing protein [Deltaproteobacteria bacterium]|nr:SurA N-terminal domain-containing protein [Deltaproteobacteria bacterium]